ncbi:amidase [Acetobacter sacchari]|uniref:Amidase n=1 Tax=Acetobacter sacchari TaxID=2661687 RepID=A0ABS3LQV7_9PROT|nr:amidase [Acetobacter sacchari]MBO1358288.1 amidase [Acetobacter sacchari]
MTTPLFLWSATRMAGAIRAGEVSARECVRAALSRVESLNPGLNAVVQFMAEDALRQADDADRVARSGSEVGPLHGVPITIKVNVDQKGYATTNGVVALRDAVAREDSPQVASLKAAGAIVIGRTNTPAFSMRWFTDNALHGRTVNPWNSAATPGGSSGGAGVAVATGMGAIGHGNDYGGSIRYPAYCCGVAGLRPSAGRVAAYNPSSSVERSLTSQMMSVQGPLARCVADLRLALQAMARPDPRDPGYVPAPLDHVGSVRSGKRVAVFRGTDPGATDPASLAALDRAAAALSEEGYVIEDAAPPHFEDSAALWAALVFNDLSGAAFEKMSELGDEALRRTLAYSVGVTKTLDREAWAACFARRLTLAREWSLFLNAYDVLLTPVSFAPPFPVDLDVRSQEDCVATLRDQAPLLPAALFGLPALSVPTGVVGGLPTGVQITADRFREDLCLMAGEAIERAVGPVWPELYAREAGV